MPKRQDQNFQDWDTVVIGKSEKQKKEDMKKKNQGKTEKKYDGGKNSQTGGSETKFDEDGLPIKKTVNPNLRNEIIKARVAKKWSQADLARNANIQTKAIQELEQGKMPNQGDLNKISRVLGQQFKKTV